MPCCILEIFFLIIFWGEGYYFLFASFYVGLSSHPRFPGSQREACDREPEKESEEASLLVGGYDLLLDVHHTLPTYVWLHPLFRLPSPFRPSSSTFVSTYTLSSLLISSFPSHPSDIILTEFSTALPSFLLTH